MLQTIVVGNLGKDATTNNVNGKTVINFSVAHSEKYKDAQGNVKEKTVWVECAWWSDRTAIVPYLKKGTTVAVTGEPGARAYKDASGEAKASLQLRISNLQLLGGARTEGATNTTQPATQQPQQRNEEYPPLSDDLLF